MLENGNAPTRRRIIIAYDGSSNSKDALALGGQLCEALDAIPVVTYCVLFRNAAANGESHASSSLRQSASIASLRKKLASYESVIFRLGNPKNHTSAKVVLT